MRPGNAAIPGSVAVRHRKFSNSRVLSNVELLDWPGRDGRKPPTTEQARGNLAALKALLEG